MESKNDPGPKSDEVHDTKFSLKNFPFNTCLLSTVMQAPDFQTDDGQIFVQLALEVILIFAETF